MLGIRCLSRSASLSNTVAVRNLAASFNPQFVRQFSVETEYQGEIADVLKEYDDRKVRRQSLVGTVVSTKAMKSITIRVAHRKYNPKYNAYTNEHRKFMAHDADERAMEGDIVRIVPCRPLSKKKRHTLMDIIRPVKKIDEEIASSA